MFPPCHWLFELSPKQNSSAYDDRNESSSSAPEVTLENLVLAVDTAWLLVGAAMVFMMQTGFAMLEVGSVSIKNSKNILIKVLIGSSSSIIIFARKFLV